MALLGRTLFFDTSLSGSGKQACASCHSPAHFYGPPDGAPAMFGGPGLRRQGVRAVPSLTYLERQPPFSIGPDKDEDDNAPNLAEQVAALVPGAPRPRKTAADTAASAVAMVPQGGLFWDGRANTLEDQALGPLLNPLEMDGGSQAVLAGKLRRGPYAGRFKQLFGAGVLADPGRLVSEALFAIARYQIEEPSFHPYTSKFDYWLEGRARFSPPEMRGYQLFNDPAKANCAGCHVDQAGQDGTPPLFTDHQFESLGAPRNPALGVNKDASYYDLGLCGPVRSDIRAEVQYCGMFLTPTLRNVATRKVFFHNGVFHSLKEVMDFYNFRDTDPGRVYPRAPDGSVLQFNDLPPVARTNVDVTDPPFDRTLGEAPAMTAAEEDDIIAFLQTLTDGYRPAK